jgi:hypothetical protein
MGKSNSSSIYTRHWLNNSFTDTDFDVRNPRYGYAEGRKR